MSPWVSINAVPQVVAFKSCLLLLCTSVGQPLRSQWNIFTQRVQQAMDARHSNRVEERAKSADGFDKCILCRTGYSDRAMRIVQAWWISDHSRFDWYLERLCMTPNLDFFVEEQKKWRHVETRSTHSYRTNVTHDRLWLSTLRIAIRKLEVTFVKHPPICESVDVIGIRWSWQGHLMFQRFSFNTSWHEFNH